MFPLKTPFSLLLACLCGLILLASSSVAATPVTISRQIMLPDGQPAIGAKILLRLFEPANTLPKQELRAETDATGTFTVEVTPATTEAGAPTNLSGFLMVDAPGAALHFEPITSLTLERLSYPYRDRPVLAPPSPYPQAAPRPSTTTARIQPKKEEPIHLKTGQAITGKVVTPQGMAVAGAEVWVQSVSSKSPVLPSLLWRLHDPDVYLSLPELKVKSGADGQFSLRAVEVAGRVPNSTESFRFILVATALVQGRPYMEKAALSLSPLQTGSAQEPLPPTTLRIAPALTLRGTATEAEANRPLPETVVHLTGNPESRLAPEDRIALTDSRGRFTRLMPALNGVALRIDQRPFLTFGRNYTIPDGASEFDVGPIAMARGVILQGVVQDATGNPARGAVVRFEQRVGVGFQGTRAVTDEQGLFASGLLQPAAVSLTLVEHQGWALTPKNHLIVMAKPDMPPLTLTARSVPLVTAKGRVVTPAGQPVKGAFVEASIRYQTVEFDGRINDTSFQEPALTDEEGYFIFKVTNPLSINIYRVTLAGHIAQKLSMARQDKGQWALTDTILTPHNGTVNGHVVNTQGEPVSGALVISPKQPQFAPVTTDAQGRFTLSSLATGGVTILAAKDRLYGEVSVKEGDTVEVRLTPPGAITAPLRQQLLERVAQDDLRTVQGYISFLGAERLLHLALQKDGALPHGEAPTTVDAEKVNWSKAGEETQQFWEWVSLRDPQWTASRGLAFVQRLPASLLTDDKWMMALGQAATALAVRGEAPAKAWAAQWLEKAQIFKAPPEERPALTARRWFLIAAVAGALGRVNADSHVLTALTYADATYRDRPITLAHYWGELLGPGGIDLFKLLDAEWPLRARRDALAGALESTASLQPELAWKFLERLERVKTDPDWPRLREELAAAHADPDEVPVRDVPLAAVALARQDAAQGLAMLQRAPRSTFQSPISRTWHRLMIGQAAVLQKQFAVAREALMPLLELSFADKAYAGALAQTFDTELANRFFTAVPQPSPARGLENRQRDTVAFAQFYQSRNPALCRLLLEDVIHRASQESIRPRDQNYEELAAAAAALCDFDPLRAVEVLATSPRSAAWGHAQARARIIAWMFADPASRPFLLNEQR